MLKGDDGFQELAWCISMCTLTMHHQPKGMVHSGSYDAEQGSQSSQDRPSCRDCAPLLWLITAFPCVYGKAGKQGMLALTHQQ